MPCWASTAALSATPSPVTSTPARPPDSDTIAMTMPSSAGIHCAFSRS
jgi:hypothetical protein